MSKDKAEIIFVCEECNYLFSETDKEVIDASEKWGHPCFSRPRSKKEYRCESYLKKFKESK